MRRKFILDGLTGLRLFLFPFSGTCPICGKPAADGNFCRSCYSYLESERLELGHCQKCGKFLTRPGSSSFCSDCRREFPLFRRGWAAAPYRGLVKEALYRFKFTGCRSLAEPLGLLMAERLRGKLSRREVDLVTAVPLHRDRLKKRRFNQSALLAARVAEKLNFPYQEEILEKVRAVPSQSKLTRAARCFNPRGSFTVSYPARVRGQRVLLVDDIYTTGSTVGECTRVLMEAGAAAVYVLTLAAGLEDPEM